MFDIGAESGVEWYQNGLFHTESGVEWYQNGLFHN